MTNQKPKRPVGRPKGSGKYDTLAIKNEILVRLELGQSLTSICKIKGLPTPDRVNTWAQDKSNPFSTEYARAREKGYKLLADQIIDIADSKPKDAVEAAQKRLQFDARRWLLSKMLPKVYGDHQHVEHSGSVDVAQVILAARKRSGAS